MANVRGNHHDIIYYQGTITKEPKIQPLCKKRENLFCSLDSNTYIVHEFTQWDSEVSWSLNASSQFTPELGFSDRIATPSSVLYILYTVAIW